ncbi:MAG: integrase core domain-containing protein [Candidatus Marinimicrobia bacterium]|nr:integrase core domain-containing protein [Candidatus Neomarinimicrobiota bacterium]
MEPDKVEAWRKDYNESRPHMSWGYLTPLEFSGVTNKIKAE